MSDDRKTLFDVIGPGILVAATGVGAGDLATAAFTGSQLGLAVLWAVVLGAFFKFVLNEGLARWQLATSSTLLEGCINRFGQVARRVFLAYLIIWSFLVSAALMSAIGAASHALWPLWGNPGHDKIFYGIVHSLAAVALVRVGGYWLFEKVMRVCIGMMFLVVVVTAVALGPPWATVFEGLVVPRIPAGGVLWTVALMGGVGGTVTILSYGYWIREEGRTGGDALTTCRVDLAVGYAMTALFGIGMLIIGSSLEQIDGGGVTLIVDIAEQLETTLRWGGTAAKWAFLVGAWGAVFSSLLGVWQGVPYLFADAWRGGTPAADCHSNRLVLSLPYRGYLYGLALVPIIGLAAVDFRTMQKTYAVVGAMFIPLVAAVLLVLNGRRGGMDRRYANSAATTGVLIAILVLFVVIGVIEIRRRLS